MTMENLEMLKVYSKEFLNDPQMFGYSAFADIIIYFAENATEEELKQFATIIVNSNGENKNV